MRGHAKSVEDYAVASLDVESGANVRLACSWKLPAGCDAIINGTFTGSYALFHTQIRNRMPASQSPNLFTLGQAGVMLAQQPFSVAGKAGGATGQRT